uniref:Adenosine 3'-phospho 5'-phosphosulfate transporter 1 n=2 Tax=Zonotrichia TaxID=44387 RepID=A0A8D2MUE9_ZONAL
MDFFGLLGCLLPLCCCPLGSCLPAFQWEQRHFGRLIPLLLPSLEKFCLPQAAIPDRRRWHYEHYTGEAFLLEFVHCSRTEFLLPAMGLTCGDLQHTQGRSRRGLILMLWARQSIVWHPIRVSVRFCIPLLLASLPVMAAGEEITPALQDSWGDFWLFRFFVNAAGYASIVVPGFLLIQYFKRRNYLETGRGICFPVIKSCVFGSEVKSVHQDDGSLPPRAEPTESSTARQVFKLLFCAAGLQISYLTWGVLQERVMTRTYGATETDPGEKFKDSQFLVFMNRILAFTVAGLYCALTKQPRHGAPMYKYSFASLSNILSSWCQYEALKYISFPTQVLAKASKVIPVMMMGKLVSRKSYEYWEYLTAALISVGVSMFLLSSAPNRTVSTVTTFSGIVLLAGYIIFDSFTSNWQDALFTYKMSPVQMMFGVNVFSCLFTVGSLLEQGALLESLRFMARHSEFTAHAVLLSVCSACGQLFIFYTINHFGAAVFTIIMTLRQAFAILLSCLIYGHTVTVVGGLGIAVVFMALFLRVYARSRMKKRSKKLPPGEAPVQKV